MLTIPTADLRGVISDVLPFAGPDDLPDLHIVQLVWDGDMLHACAYDTIRAAVSSWHPTDRPEKDVQEDLFASLGSGDEPWMVLLDAGDAADLLAAFKPKKGYEYVPLHVDWHNGLLKVRRDRAARLPGAQIELEGQEHTFPDLRVQVAEAGELVEKVDEIAFNVEYLAALAKVRQRGGAATFTFGGSTRPTIVTIGERFTAAISPVRTGE